MHTVNRLHYVIRDKLDSFTGIIENKGRRFKAAMALRTFQVHLHSRLVTFRTISAGDHLCTTRTPAVLDRYTHRLRDRMFRISRTQDRRTGRIVLPLFDRVVTCFAHSVVGGAALRS